MKSFANMFDVVGFICMHQVDTLTESGAVFKVAQSTFNIMWRRLPDALGV